MSDTPVQTANYVADPGRIADLAQHIREENFPRQTWSEVASIA